MKVVMMKWGDVVPYEKNPRINEDAVQYVANSIKEFGFQQPIVVDKNNVIIVGHTRWKAAARLKMKEVPVVVASNLTEEQSRAYRIADNSVGDVAQWDFDLLADEITSLDYDFGDFGITLSEDDGEVDFSDLESRQGEKDQAYQEFVDKFKPKVTTDDCYTPMPVYEAVKQWVFETYGEREKIVRPFYPGGDYTKEEYPEGCLVLDNPPFSIITEIAKYYKERNIDFFLFAPHLTALNCISHGICCILPHAQITYENGAEVLTAFWTNLEDNIVRVTSSLGERIAATQPKDTADLKSYEYPPNLVTGAMLGRLAQYGSEFVISHAVPVSDMDEGTQIYGKGALISDSMAEKVKAEKVKAEKVKIPINLSERERALIEELNRLEAENGES